MSSLVFPNAGAEGLKLLNVLLINTTNEVEVYIISFPQPAHRQSG
jgi:hypothetical protein